MAENLEDRVDSIESVLSERDWSTTHQMVQEALDICSRVLSDIVKDLDNAAEYRDDLDRLDTLTSLLL
jgi:hypothetical protein